MADWMNYLTPPPSARNVNALSVSYRPPSLRDVVAVAAYGDARQDARIWKRLQEIRVRDAIGMRRPPLMANPPVARAPLRAAFRPPWLGAPLRQPRAPDRIERSAGRRTRTDMRHGEDNT